MKLEIMMIPSKIISARIQCTYRNESNRFQVIRVEDDKIERTMAAGQVFEFEAPMDSYLDVHTSEIVTMILSDRIPCRQLTG
jgi:Domain of unknown function (DUF1830)